MTQPFLLRFAKTCTSPTRNPSNITYRYDKVIDMVRWLGQSDEPLAIDVNDATGPMTKKADIEKGEDNKDRRMWS